MSHRFIWIALLCPACFAFTQPVTADPAAADLEFFERHIRPVLSENCHRCHSSQAEELRAGLRLESVDDWRRGGESGPAVVPGDPEASLLLKAIRYDEDVAPMPPDRKLPPEVVQHFVTWIMRGAVGPEATEASLTAETPAAPSAPGKAEHWAFQVPRSANLEATGWRAEIGSRRTDRIIAKHLAARDLQPSPSALREVLIRRLYYDLIGLPPSFDQVRTFVGEESPVAYQRLVERLLASPRFGERWGRYWLDLARFSDTKGYVFTEDRNYPDAYKYRDWVIESLNIDRPFDEFVRHQLAADQLTADDPEQLAAMGFLTLGRRFLNNRHDIIDDRIDVTTRGLMGLTVTCARCHDHKYDPIPTEDYYSLYGVFASSREPGDAPSPLRLVDQDQPVTPVVFLRGQPGQRGAEVPRQFLGVLSGEDRQPFHNGSGRLEMANAIASPDNPLTARVFVNRVWGHLFGSYLVDTPSDFGMRSPQPPLAELLDDLAVEFMRHDWSVKWLVRELVLSSTYRQASDRRSDLERIDPENRLYGRMNRRRLDFEAMRDSLLFVSGQLDARSIGGPSTDISGEGAAPRRSLYAHIDRQNFPGLFRVFDVAAPDTHVPKRFETTVPQQGLYLLNSPFAMECAERLSTTTRHLEADPGERVCEIYRRILGRDPDAWELQRGVDFTTAVAESADAQALAAQFSQALLISNEFFFLD